MKQAILLLSNRTDYAVNQRYDKLVTDYGGQADVYLLFDATRGIDEIVYKNFERVFPFNVIRMIENGYTALKDGFLGNCHYPVLIFHQEHPEYDYCWIVEDDVVFSGDWSVLFDTFVNDPADLVATNVRRYEDEPTWFWWQSMKAGNSETLANDEMFACFIPIYRLSKKAINCLELEMQNGWRGHFEGVVPTVLMRHGLTIRDMNGKGYGTYNRDGLSLYSHDTHTYIPLSVRQMSPNMIYHPIKEKIGKKTYKSYCLLSVVGEHSRHKEWMIDDNTRDYDIHLVVYDMSFGKHYDDADFVYVKRGRKVELIKDYLESHEYLLKQYDYFFIIDERCGMDVEQINNLFDEMTKENSEFSFVGMTMPCLRQDIMLRVLKENPETSILFF